ncbi:unnamed protein product [Ranitomeya imitator]|uniref:Rab-GAP TBC domain-containing protein n=1 Tax=Ranitomeya imitator TaxID=111125 RepID=A0ABN9LSP4_9NEOB|nr:unnamed protein product [Ranitomeya imitator]
MPGLCNKQVIQHVFRLPNSHETCSRGDSRACIAYLYRLGHDMTGQLLLGSDMKKDIEALIAQERADIISKYERGRQTGVEIDPWEDADFALYKVTDRFGFLHEHELPSRTAAEEKQKLQEIERVDKWLKMLKKWTKYRNSEKMFRRVYKGIPLQVRGQVWSLLLDVEAMKSENGGKYEKMKDLAKMYSTEIKQIDLDVNRTFRNHIMFRERYGVKQTALFDVLSAYSVYNTLLWHPVGFCACKQGRSQRLPTYLRRTILGGMTAVSPAQCKRTEDPK